MLLILESIRPISAHREYVFPADRDPKTHTNSQTANMALKRMGFENRLVSHGLRSIASTVLNEQGFDRDLVEAALAHVDANLVRSAYNRTDYLERRREMMQWWSDCIEKAGEGHLSVAAQVYARSEKNSGVRWFVSPSPQPPLQSNGLNDLQQKSGVETPPSPSNDKCWGEIICRYGLPLS